MDLRVAVHTAASQRLRGRHTRWQLSTGERHAWMSGFRVALLAKEGRPLREEPGMVASVRLMTQRAVLRHRGVLPEIRPALFGVAGETGVVERATDKGEVGRGAMRVVAVAAGHAIQPQGVRIRQETLRALPRVAAHAGLRLCRLDQHRIVRLVNLVATDARHAFTLVRAARPAITHMRILTVTAETGAVLLLDGCG